ncbi:hypothetical protein L1987_15634 [Smallanthus sonchifolius]|uniref:Uncharacterized protein n=1 Tax=Smallanthus sonchifolius TaxID=185202 RepID=A0ACB9J882_9ASTR|nr:hypothetical protein L1987_15634 [Smallanthus sonchifolius]
MKPSLVSRTRSTLCRYTDTMVLAVSLLKVVTIKGGDPDFHGRRFVLLKVKYSSVIKQLLLNFFNGSTRHDVNAWDG